LGIAFINPPFLPRYSRSQRSPGVIKSGVIYYPYWLAHAAAFSYSKGHQVVLIDAPAAGLDLDATLGKVTSFGANLAVLDTSTPSIDADLLLAKKIKEAIPNCFIAMCGAHATALPEQVLENDGPDAVVMGEFDITATELAEAIDSGGDIKTVPGLALKNSVKTKERALIENLDDLPWIAPIYKKFLDPKNYYFSLAKSPMAMLISGRGCPNQCFFCLYPQVMHGRRYRTRSPEHIVGEIEYIVKEMPEIREIVFEDDTFTADQNRTVEFCQLLIRKRIRIPWFANVRVDTKPETLKTMKAAGFRSCAVGFETGSQELLDNMKKGIRIDKAKKFMSQAKKLGILVHGCFMVAFPGETKKSMEQTLRYAIELDPDSAQFYPVFPYPGTEAYVWATKNGYLKTTEFRQWLTESGSHASLIDLPDISAEEILTFCEKAYKRFHFRPRYLLRKLWQAVIHPYEGLRSLRSFAYYLRYLISGSE